MNIHILLKYIDLSSQATANLHMHWSRFSLKLVITWQTWGQIQKYLYLKVFKYFFWSICICICIWAFQNEKYLYLYLNTFKKYLIFQIQFKYISNTFVIFSFYHILSSPAILLMPPILYGLLLLVNWDQHPMAISGTQEWTSVWGMKMSLLVML